MTEEQAKRSVETYNARYGKNSWATCYKVVNASGEPRGWSAQVNYWNGASRALHCEGVVR